MNKKYFSLPLWLMLLPLVIFLIGIIIGSFLDLQISKTIADMSNPIGTTFETIGYSFAYAMIAVAATTLALGLIHREKCIVQILGYIVWALGIAISIYMLGNAMVPEEFGYGPRLNVYASYSLSTLITLFASAITFLILDKKEEDKLLLIGLLLVLSILLEFVFINIFKFLNCRPRYRFLYSDYNTINAVFRNWFEFKPFSIPEGIESDFYKSWPSGHTAFSAHLMLLAFLTPVLKRRNRFTSSILFSIGFVLCLFIAFTRILCGAHFLSDVSFGGFISWSITIILIFVMQFALNKSKKGSINGLEVN